MNTQKLLTTSLDDIAPLIAFFPKMQLASLCDISPATLDRYRDNLIAKQVPRFKWYFYSTGYDRDSAECMWQYAQLAKLMRVSRAKDLIKFHMEEFWNEYDKKNR